MEIKPILFSVLIILVLCLSRDKMTVFKLNMADASIFSVNTSSDILRFMIQTIAIKNATLQLYITSKFTNTCFIAGKTVFICGLKLCHF